MLITHMNVSFVTFKRVMPHSQQQEEQQEMQQERASLRQVHMTYILAN